MKYFVVVCNFLVLSSFLVFSYVYSATPFQPHTEKRFQALEKTFSTKLQYGVATNGGTSGTAYGLGVFLPAKAVITRSFVHIDTQFVDDGTGTIALSCEDAGNIRVAGDITGSTSGTFLDGASTGAIAGFKSSIAARCEVTATVSGANASAGKLTGWLNYVIHD